MQELLLAAQLSSTIPTIDLHGIEHTATALEQLEKELFSFYTKKQRLCRVVHGIGEGVLAAAVHQALSANPMVQEWQEEESGGSCVVVL